MLQTSVRIHLAKTRNAILSSLTAVNRLIHHVCEAGAFTSGGRWTTWNTHMQWASICHLKSGTCVTDLASRWLYITALAHCCIAMWLIAQEHEHPTCDPQYDVLTFHTFLCLNVIKFIVKRSTPDPSFMHGRHMSPQKSPFPRGYRSPSNI